MKKFLLLILIVICLSCSFKETPEATLGWWTLKEVFYEQRYMDNIEIQLWESERGIDKRVVVRPGNHYKKGDKILSFIDL